MKLMIRIADKLVGLFILTALLFLAAALIFMGLNQRWLATNYTYHSRFRSGDGLSIDMPIKLKGFQIGKVTDIELNSQNRVDITFEIYDTYHEKITYNSILILASSPLGLGGGLVFYPGRAETLPLPEDSFIPSTDFQEAQSLIEAGLVDKDPSDDQITAIMNQVQTILAGIPAIEKNIEGTTAEVETLIASVNATLEGRHQGPVGEILRDLKVSVETINSSLMSIETLTGELEDPTGLVPRVMKSDSSVSKILNDDNEELYQEIFQILNSLSGTLREVNELTQYVNQTSPQLTGLIEETRGAVSEGQQVLEGLKNNPLLRGGVSREKEQPSSFESLREEDF